MVRNLAPCLAATAWAALFLVSVSAIAAESPLETVEPKDPKLAKFYRELAEAEKERKDKASQDVAEKSPPGDPFKWARSLDVPGAGEWEPISYSADGGVVDYGTRRRAARKGHIASVWIRTEWRDSRPVQSMATRKEFDCVNDTVL
jgi:hypothetical protein